MEATATAGGESAMNPQDVHRYRTYQAERKVSYSDAWYEAERAQCEAERAKANGNGSVASCEPEQHYCFCDELVIRGQRQPICKFHDCEYVRRRNGLIAEAERIADSRCRKSNGGEWTKKFGEAMQRLSAPLLNGSSNGSAAQTCSSVDEDVPNLPSISAEIDVQGSSERLIDETGNHYGRLTVIGRAGERGGKVRWRCACRCGRVTVVYGDNLRAGRTRSCGCLRSERNIKHGSVMQ